MTVDYWHLAAWAVQSGLIALLIATLIYARRLDRLLRHVRSDQDALQAILPQFDGLISATTTATDRLVQNARQADTGLQDACAAAEIMIGKLDDLIGQASQTIHARTARPSTPDQVDTAAHPKPQRRPVKLASRVERDLARMLLDAP